MPEPAPSISSSNIHQRIVAVYNLFRLIINIFLYGDHETTDLDHELVLYHLSELERLVRLGDFGMDGGDIVFNSVVPSLATSSSLYDTSINETEHLLAHIGAWVGEIVNGQTDANMHPGTYNDVLHDGDAYYGGHSMSGEW